MNPEIEKFFKEANEILKDCEVYNFITRGKELQISACKTLEEILKKTTDLKMICIDRKENDEANLLLGLEGIIKSLSEQLHMWVAFKEDQMDKAWDHLINSQDAALGALHIDNQFEYLKDHIKRLYLIEHLVFPPQVFDSVGFDVRSEECSICGKEYEDCEHIAGKPYMGKFCYLIVREAELTHTSIVADPADKRCRIIKFSDENGWRNRMTWRIEQNGK